MSLTVAIIGAGPAGIYAADILQSRVPGSCIDLYEKLPAPYGLVRYGVAPDHPRIKKIQDALHDVLEHPRIRLLCNVEVGADVTINQLRQAYDAVIVATGADRDAELDIPGIELPGSYGGAEFVAWYDGHPDAPRSWPLDAESVAVIGAGNVALDVTRMLSKHPDGLSATDVPVHVETALKYNPVRDIHMFIRRGPAEVKFSLLELRELGKQHDVDVIIDPQQLLLDDYSAQLVTQHAGRRRILEVMEQWARTDPSDQTASRRVHMHFYRQPVRLLGTDNVTGLELQHMALDDRGQLTPTGEYSKVPLGAVYRTIGYRSSPVPGVPFDAVTHTIPETKGRVVDEQGQPVPGLYTTGWIRRGPTGLIGSTKSDAKETIESLLSDMPKADRGSRARPLEGLQSQLADVVEWKDWLQIDAAEQRLGQTRGRTRTKIVDRSEMLEHVR